MDDLGNLVHSLITGDGSQIASYVCDSLERMEFRYLSGSGKFKRDKNFKKFKQYIIVPIILRFKDVISKSKVFGRHLTFAIKFIADTARDATPILIDLLAKIAPLVESGTRMAMLTTMPK